MLNGDSNENSKKSLGLISKRKNFAHAAHFFVHSFDVVLHNYMYNVKLPTCLYTSCIGKVVFAHFFFSLPLIFTLLAATCSISHFLTTNFHGFFCYFLPLPMPVVRTGMHMVTLLLKFLGYI